MISRKQKPTFRFEGERYYIFIKQVIDKKGKTAHHVFLFDDTGGCFESRLLCHKKYLKWIEETVLIGQSGNARPVWELLPNGEPAYPAATYEPLLTQVESDPDSAKPPICYDKLYAMEIMLQA